ncbi:glycosyltransferase family 4 protein [Leptolyngbya sp. 15MV]|nr:glycosyltransferase family 4 protein [Leptolyngbya sp. 15MV]
MRRVGAGDFVSTDGEGDEDTFVILERGVIGALADLGAMLARQPLRFFSVLALALRHRAHGIRSLVWALFHFAEAAILAARLRRDGIGHLHNHFANSGATVGMLAARLNGIGWSLTLHGISEFDHPAGYLLPDKIARAEFVACASYFIRAQAMRLVDPRHWSRMHIVRCAVSPCSLPEPADHPPGDTLRIVCVARLSAEKAHSGLLAAVEQLTGEGLALHVRMIGFGPDHDRLSAEVAARGLEARCTFEGYLDEAATLRAIAESDLLVLPSFMEGLPMVLVEALALHVPVVASRVAGIPELVIEEQTGLLFQPSDWGDLAAKIERFARDPDLRRRLALAGAGIVRREFMHPEAARPLKRLFRHED